MRNHTYAALCLAFALAGCAGHGGPAPSKWIASKSIDRFSDEELCRVWPRDAAIDNGIVAARLGVRLSLYPFVERRKSGLRVGLVSAGVKIPAGEVQIRIDKNSAWTISTAETPVDSEGVNSEAFSSRLQGMAANNPALKNALAGTSLGAATAMNQAMSPYTAATGEKAEKILGEMKAGIVAIYQRVGANQPNSTTGEILLGAEFLSSLAECGIR